MGAIRRDLEQSPILDIFNHVQISGIIKGYPLRVGQATDDGGFTAICFDAPHPSGTLFGNIQQAAGTESQTIGAGQPLSIDFSRVAAGADNPGQGVAHGPPGYPQATGQRYLLTGG